MTTETSSVAVKAPKVSALQLRALLDTPGAVLVHLPTGDTEVAPEGLTKAQSLNPDLVVVLTDLDARHFVYTAQANYTVAARTASAVLRAQFEREVGA